METYTAQGLITLYSLLATKEDIAMVVLIIIAVVARKISHRQNATGRVVKPHNQLPKELPANYPENEPWYTAAHGCDEEGHLN